jgi:hypothetical protein
MFDTYTALPVLMVRCESHSCRNKLMRRHGTVGQARCLYNTNIELIDVKVLHQRCITRALLAPLHIWTVFTSRKEYFACRACLIQSLTPLICNSHPQLLLAPVHARDRPPTGQIPEGWNTTGIGPGMGNRACSSAPVKASLRLPH